MTDEPVGSGVLRGHRFAFTIGRGNELCVSAAKIYSDRLIGFDFQQIIDDRRKSDVGRARSNRLGLLGEFDLHWIEEHTSPDDINGGATHLRVRPKSA